MALKDFEGLERRVIRKGKEMYLTLPGKSLVFKERVQVLGSRLATVGKKPLKTGLNSCKIFMKRFYMHEVQTFRLLVRKGLYPYEDIILCEKMNDKQLAHKEAFYSNLAASNIASEDFANPHQMWDAF